MFSTFLGIHTMSALTGAKAFDMWYSSMVKDGADSWQACWQWPSSSDNRVYSIVLLLFSLLHFHLYPRLVTTSPSTSSQVNSFVVEPLLILLCLPTIWDYVPSYINQSLDQFVDHWDLCWWPSLNCDRNSLHTSR